MPQYTGYVQCPAGQDVPVSVLCDRGATATDDGDGDLTDLVLACGESYKVGLCKSKAILKATDPSNSISHCNVVIISRSCFQFRHAPLQRG